MKKILKLFVKKAMMALHVFPVEKKKIFFYDGGSCGFDAKALALHISSKEPGKWKIVWGVDCYKRYNDEIVNDDISFVILKSLKGYFNLITAGTVFYSINAPSFIPFRKNQMLINSWHGLPFKKVGRYIGEKNKEQVNLTTCYLSQAEWYTNNIIRDSFLYEGEVIPSGVPRNDIFYSDRVCETSRKVRRFYNIPEEDKIVLYAPTFRGDFKYKESGLDFEKTRNSLIRKFGGNWHVLFRLHPSLASNTHVNYSNVINASLYKDMQELLCSADVFISDYTSAIWDFSLTRRPVFIYAPDINDYKNSRGLYVDMYDLPYPLSQNIEELVSSIQNFDNVKYQDKLEHYLSVMGCYDKGVASQTILKLMHDKHNI